jgi:polysaccharide chain length determinant protein (PEP-CTERM system associated)
MHDLIEQVTGLLRSMWQRRWIGLAAAWIVGIVAVGVVYRIPQKYEASARVYVDTESLLRPLLAGLAVQPNLDQQVALISRTLVSRPNVEKLIRMADMDLSTHTNAEVDALVDRVTKAITLQGNGQSNLYVISYRDSSPPRAQKVVQSLLTIFVESSLGDKRQDTQTAVKFLDDQIRNYERNLESAENRIKDFKLKYMGVAGNSQGQDYFGRVAKVSGDIEGAKLELQSAEQARDAYKKEVAGEEPVFLPEPEDGAVPDQEVNIRGNSETEARIVALKRDLDTLLRKYTEQHPDVIATRRLIEQLEVQRQAELEARRKAIAALPQRRDRLPVDQNPVYQQMKISLADAEARVAAARAKLSGLESQRRRLQDQAVRIPEAEAEYVQLNRDYDVQKRMYESLVARRESASMGKDVQDTSGARFRVIDPPRVSPEPVAPNRLALLGLALVASLGAGALASVGAGQLMPTFHDARSLRETTSRPILGMVSMLPSEALHVARKRKSWLFAGGLGALLAAFGAIFAFALVIGRAA